VPAGGPVTITVALKYYLIVAPHILLGGVLLCLFRRKLYRTFPVFLIYVASELIQFSILFTMILLPSTSGREYGITYSASSAVSTALRFGVIYEIFLHLFRNYPILSRLGKPMLRWATTGLLLAALTLAVYTGGNRFNQVMYLLNVLDRTASILQCGLLIALLSFAAYLGISLRSHVFGIALGLGIFASVELTNAAIRTHLGQAYSAYLDYLTMATYHICVLIWIWYLWAPEKIPAKSVQQLPEHNLETWNQELQRFIQQ
jgi:hypothetical protein